MDDPIDYIRAEMERRGLRQIDLVPAFGSRARASEILNRKRALTVAMIRALQIHFDMDANALIQSYELKSH